MWFFKSPEIVFGDDALSYLERLEGKRAFIVTDATMVKLGHAARVEQVLRAAGLDIRIFDGVEPDPSLETVWAGAQAMSSFAPEWIVGLGGGSALDAAKAMWILYERPDIDPAAINPMEKFGLRSKARMVAIPTTSGTGSEVTWFTILSSVSERRKLALGSREAMADIAILDPVFVASLPPRVTADTGLDALTHAIEAFTCQYYNDFSDALAVKASQLIFEYLPRAYQDGHDAPARFKMHCAASIAGLAFGNAWAGLAHSLGHAVGGVFHIPHGRAVALFLPYTIEFCARGEGSSTRYGELARLLGLPGATEHQAAASLAAAIRQLEGALEQPRTLEACGLRWEDLEREMETLVAHAGNDNATLASTRFPSNDELRKLFEYAYKGQSIDF